MIIYPAIDLRDGKCVRLYKGDFATTKIYNENPAAMLEEFASTGNKWVHMVDLDGAKAGKVVQADVIAELVQNSNLKIQVGGGIRTTEDVERLFAAGVSRVVVGSASISNPQLVNSWIERFSSEKIVLALDCTLDKNNEPRVRINGWQEESPLSVYEVLARYPEAKYVLCTDISVDGTLKGPNLTLYLQIQFHCPTVKVIASGGVGSLEDLDELNKLGVYGVVIGKALYENKFTLSEAMKV